MHKLLSLILNKKQYGDNLVINVFSRHTSAPLGPGNPITPGAPRDPAEPGGPGAPS